jgi:hypothetical protein
MQPKPSLSLNLSTEAKRCFESPLIIGISCSQNFSLITLCKISCIILKVVKIKAFSLFISTSLNILITDFNFGPSFNNSSALFRYQGKNVLKEEKDKIDIFKIEKINKKEIFQLYFLKL